MTRAFSAAFQLFISLQDFAIWSVLIKKKNTFKGYDAVFMALTATYKWAVLKNPFDTQLWSMGRTSAPLECTDCTNIQLQVAQEHR